MTVSKSFPYTRVVTVLKSLIYATTVLPLVLNYIELFFLNCARIMIVDYSCFMPDNIGGLHKVEETGY